VYRRHEEGDFGDDARWLAVAAEDLAMFTGSERNEGLSG
jgi:hypothetical protein